ncbi:hypothetical protein ACFWIQ_27100 [Kitasatospora sp. NPDC127059]|uniref:hypothetical protein n=1 Tax=unclassified Kitasatospora TaxID=2633591 RepID=UPI003666FD77
MSPSSPSASWASWAAATSFAYAAGTSGRPGKLTADRCWGDNPAKPHLITSCAGGFRSDDGRTVTEDSPIGGSHRIGAALPVEYGDGDSGSNGDGDGDYHATGFSYATGDLAGLLAVPLPVLPVGMLGLWLVGLAFGTRSARVRHHPGRGPTVVDGDPSPPGCSSGRGRPPSRGSAGC